MNLTDRTVRAFQSGPAQVDVWDDTVRGFGIRVSPGGRKAWVLRYRVNGRQRRLTLSSFPALSLAHARKAARQALGDVAHGRDPAADKQADRTAETFADLALEYLERHAKRHKKSWREDARIINAELLSRWRHRLVKTITRREVRDAVEEVADRAPIMGNRVLALIRKMLNFAVEREWIEANPAALLKKPGQERSRDCVLTADETRSVWHAFDTELSPTMGAAFKVRYLTGQRGAEVLGMEWDHLDLATRWWEIPGTLTKNGEVHRVPLVSATLKVLREQRARVPDGTPWVFANELGTGSVHHRAKRVAARLSQALGLAFRGHDLRRTCATGMAEAGVAVETIAKVLNHVDRGARATHVYDRYSYDAEKRQALEIWARRLRAIVKGHKLSRRRGRGR